MKKYKEILILIVMQISVYQFVGNAEILLNIKYFTMDRVIYIMISILFNYLYLYYFIEQYYTYILNRNHVITRCGMKEYYKLVLKKVLGTIGIFFISNLILDYIIVKKVIFSYLIINTLYFLILIIVLPKKREYSFELSISLLVTLITKYLYYIFVL